MTFQQECKIAGLVGRLKGRQELLEADIEAADMLHYCGVSLRGKGYQHGTADTLRQWLKWNNSLLAEIKQLLKEAESG